MIDCERNVSADGCDAEKVLTICCLSESTSMDSFVVSEHIDDQAFTIQSVNSVSDAEVCEIPTQKIDTQVVLSIQSNQKQESAVSVTPSQSGRYSVAEYISAKISITINVLKSVIIAVVRHVHRTFTNMKGRQQRLRVYALCLLRL